MHGEDLTFFLEGQSSVPPSSPAAQPALPAHSEVTHPPVCGLAAGCKLALAKLIRAGRHVGI